MYKALIILLCLVPLQLFSQIIPKEGSKLNYRIIGFSLPEAPVGKCKLEIASGNHQSDSTFKKSIVASLAYSSNRIIAEVPAFGCAYTWRVVSDNDPKFGQGTLHHFSTLASKFTDTSVFRMRITKQAAKYRDAFVFADGNKALYDMKGHPVWFLPNIDSIIGDHADVRDLQLTPFGTITFMVTENVYEISYDGEILWKGPGNIRFRKAVPQHYHHEFTRLNNGHYMVMGDEITDVVLKKGDNTSIDSDLFFVSSPGPGVIDSVHQKMLFPTILEYDHDGKLVWSYHSSAYFKESYLLHSYTPDGNHDINPHGNGFYFDEEAKTVYISYRNLDRIVKLKYPEGNVLASYGTIYQPGNGLRKNGMFCYQHSCRKSGEGFLYLFNNNVCHQGAPPAVTMWQESAKERSGLKKVWEYTCTIEDKDKLKDKNFTFSSGGSVAELPDHSLLVSMGTYYSKIFIIGIDKQVLWSAMAEKWDEQAKKWKTNPQYRASIIPGIKSMGQIIWNR